MWIKSHQANLCESIIFQRIVEVSIHINFFNQLEFDREYFQNSQFIIHHILKKFGLRLQMNRCPLDSL